MEHNLQLQRQGRAERGGGGGFQDLPASVVVYNLSGLSLARVTKCAKGLAALVRVVGLAEEHYPENLRKAIIINVPSLFLQFRLAARHEGAEHRNFGKHHDLRWGRPAGRRGV